MNSNLEDLIILTKYLIILTKYLIILTKYLISVDNRIAQQEESIDRRLWKT